VLVLGTGVVGCTHLAVPQREWVSPPASGRVVAADTRTPIANASVTRDQPGRAPSEVRTEPDGRFQVAGVRKLRWSSSDRLAFGHLRIEAPGFLPAEVEANGEAVRHELRLDFGDVLLARTNQIGASRSRAEKTPTDQQVLTRVKRFVRSARLYPRPEEPKPELAGWYVPTDRGNYLAGNNLYLFPDGSYLYSEWADILSETIFDRGTWDYQDGRIRLETDNSVPQTFTRHDHLFLVLQTEDRFGLQTNLMGLLRDYEYFRKNASWWNGSFQFELRSKMRLQALTNQEATTLKARLMRDCWRPEFFTN
jgi:hypothetical protein